MAKKRTHKKNIVVKSTKRQIKIEKLTRIKEEFDKNQERPLSLDDVIIKLCSQHKRSFLLSESIIQELSDLSSLTGRTTNNLISSFLTSGIKDFRTRWTSAKEKMKNMKKNEILKANFAGSAEIRIDKVVKEIMNKNDKIKNPMKKVFISQTLLKKLTNGYVPSIKAYLEKNKEIIDSHHLKHNLTPRHNFSVEMLKKSQENKE
jgi:hypothetical protein